MSEKKTTPVVRKRILRDNILGITKPGLRRILHRAGVVRVSTLVYEEMRSILKVQLENVLRTAVELMQYARKKTLSYEHVRTAVKLTTGKVLLVPKGIGGETGRSSSQYTERKEKKRHAKPGAVVMVEIRHLQKSDTLLLRRLPYKRFVRELLQDYVDEVKVSANAHIALQYFGEIYLTELSQDAILCAVHGKRKKVQSNDFMLARRIRGERA